MSGHRKLAVRAGRIDALAWSPDGRRIAFLSTAGTGCDFCSRIHVVDPDGRGERYPTPRLGQPRRRAPCQMNRSEAVELDPA